MQFIFQARQPLGDFAHKKAFETDNESPNGTWSRKMGPGAETRKPAVVAHTSRRDEGFLSRKASRSQHTSLPRREKSQKSMKYRMQNAHEGWWADVKSNKSKDVSRRIQCSRMVEHVCSVSTFGCASRSFSQYALHKIKGWETKHHETIVADESWVSFCTKTTRLA